MKIESFRQVQTERTDERRLAFLELLSEPKMENIFSFPPNLSDDHECPHDVTAAGDVALVTSTHPVSPHSYTILLLEIQSRCHHNNCEDIVC